MLTLATKQVFRTGGVQAGLAFLLVAGLVSLLIGRQFLDRQQRTIVETATAQRTDFARNAEEHRDEIGLLLYYLRFSLVNDTPPLTGLSIGQRDVNASVQRVTIRGLEGQKYDADLNNPTNLLSGNLDFSFVLLYLFPLLIIAFCYNLISDEKERGTWRIVVVQSRHLFRFVGQLFLIRIALLMVVMILLIVAAILVLKLPLDASFWAFVGMSILYVLDWFGVCFWVVSLQKSSATNALLLLTVWLSLLLILPALVNAWLVKAYPTPEALSMILQQRKSYHEKWDTDKTKTLNAFYVHYLQLRNLPPYRLATAAAPFDWTWYYAMQQAGDDESAQQARALRQKLQQRVETGQQIAQFVPTMHTQLQLNELARSGLTNQLRFLDETTRFHEAKRLYYYPKIIASAPVSAENWAAVPIETFTDQPLVSYARIWGPLLLFLGVFLGAGWLNFRRTLYQL